MVVLCVCAFRLMSDMKYSFRYKTYGESRPELKYTKVDSWMSNTTMIYYISRHRQFRVITRVFGRFCLSNS